MRRYILISAVAATAFCAKAQEPEFELALPELPVIRLCAVEEGSEAPVPFASISVEYVDTIVAERCDGMGLLDFTPRSFPLTVTATGDGMQASTYGLMDHPEGPLTILMTREPADEPKTLLTLNP